MFCTLRDKMTVDLSDKQLSAVVLWRGWCDALRGNLPSHSLSSVVLSASSLQRFSSCFTGVNWRHDGGLPQTNVLIDRSSFADWKLGADADRPPLGVVVPAAAAAAGNCHGDTTHPATFLRSPNGTERLKPRPHQQQCRSNVRLCGLKRQQCRTSLSSNRPIVLSTKSNVASTLLPFLATMLPVSAECRTKFRPFDKVETS